MTFRLGLVLEMYWCMLAPVYRCDVDTVVIIACGELKKQISY